MDRIGVRLLPKRRTSSPGVSPMSLSKLFGIAVLGALFAGSACSSQGEGQRCDPSNGDDDCESGLVCVEASKLIGGGPDTTWALCCPASETQQTVEACFRSSNTTGTGGSPGSAGDSGVDANSSGGAPGPDATTG